MNDVWADPVPEPISPCNMRCGVSSVTGYCTGCWRSLKEIAEWDQMDKDDQLECLKRVKERRDAC